MLSTVSLTGLEILNVNRRRYHVLRHVVIPRDLEALSRDERRAVEGHVLQVVKRVTK